MPIQRINTVSLWFCLLIAQLCLSKSAIPQASSNYNINYRLLTQEDGLASRNVNAGIQDSRGFIWLGTRDGLNKYDGYKFQLFTKEKNGLQENNVVYLSEDADKKLWILYGKEGVNTLSRGKLDILDINSHKTVSFDDYFGKTAPFKQGNVVGIAGDRKHDIYIYCDNGIVYLYSGKHTFRQLNSTPLTKPLSQFVFINHATDSGIWLRYDYFIDRKGQITKAPRYDSGFYAMSFVGESQQLLMYLGKERDIPYTGATIVNVSPKGITHYNSELPAATKKQFYDICKFDFYMVLRDVVTGNSVIQSGGNSLYLFRDKKFISLLDTNRIKIPSLSITSVFTDHEGKLWVCSNVGLMVFKINPNYFTHYLNSAEYNLKGERPNYQTRGIYADTIGNIFISTTTGAYHIQEKEGSLDMVQIGDAPYSCPMIKDGDNIYFGHDALFEYNAITKTKKDLFWVNGMDAIWNVWKLAEDKWWVSNQSEFLLHKNGSFHPIKNGRTGDALKNVWVHQFFKDHTGTVWIVGSKGLFQMQNDSAVSLHWGTQETDPRYKLPFDGIHSICEDEDHNFWMATDGNGLYKWDRADHTFQHFTIADGLSSNLLYGILEDEKGYLWISSDNGLMRFNKKDYRVKTYSIKDGITNSEFNRVSYFKAANGRMYFGGIDGVNAFYPGDFWHDNKVFSAPLQVTSYSQFKDSSGRLEDLTPGILATNKIVLQPGDNFFIIEFAMLDFENGKHRYAYKIDGIDNDWDYLEANRLRIGPLPYGNYTLRIKGQNNDGQWSVKEIAIPVQVMIPFYKRTGFIVGCVVLFLVLSAAFFRYRIWWFKKRNLALENVIQSRTVELRASLVQKDILLKEIHHRVKNNLQVISGLLQLQSRKTDDPASKEVLLESHNRVLSIALIHQKLYQNEKPDTIEFASFANELFSHIAGVFSKETLQVSFHNKLPELYLDVDVAVPLGLILNELMTNSFKYAFNNTEAPFVMLEMIVEGNDSVLLFTDNGIGLPPGFDIRATKSLGMHLIYRLTQQLNGKVTYYNGSGAAFRFSFPSGLINPAKG